MSDPNEMQVLFADTLNTKIEKHVPVKEFKQQSCNHPEWFNKKAQKLTPKHRRTYNRYKKTGDPFFSNKYKLKDAHAKKK